MRAASLIRASSAAKPSAVLPKSANHVFHQAACGSAIESMRGPLEPIISGGGDAGRGRRTASSACQKRPSSVTRSPASSPRMIAQASSKRPTRRS